MKTELTTMQKQDICARFAENMPVLRKQLKLTQEKLGEMCGYSRIRISNIETKREKLSWHQLLCISFVFLLNEDTNKYIKENSILDEEFFSYFNM